MATETNTTNPSRFHNLSNEALADAIGAADAVLKAAEAELKSLKEELKSRGVEEATGEHYTVSCRDQIAGRLDTAAVKAFLGDGYAKFERAVISTVIRIKASNQRGLAAALAS